METKLRARRSLLGLSEYLGQVCCPHKIAVTFPRGTAAFVDRPNHETLAAPAIASGKHTRDAGRKLAEFRLGVRARIPFNSKLRQYGVLRSEESHCQQHQIGAQKFLGFRNSFRDECSLLVLGPLHVIDVKLFDI